MRKVLAVVLLLVSAAAFANHYSHSFTPTGSCTYVFENGVNKRVCEYRCIIGGETMWR